MWSTLARIAAAVLAQDNPILKLARLGNQKQSPAVAAHVFRTVCGKADEWRRGDEPWLGALRSLEVFLVSTATRAGVAPLVVASGAGASARKSIGIAVFTGMIASTCLAVLFVPSFFMVVQRFEQWRGARNDADDPEDLVASGSLNRAVFIKGRVVAGELRRRARTSPDRPRC